MPIKTQTVRITLNPRAGTPENCIFVGKAIVKNEQGIDIEMAMENTNRMFKDWGKNHDEDAKKKHFFRSLTRGEEILIKYKWELTEDGRFANNSYKDQEEVLRFLRAMPNVEVKGGDNKNKKANPPFLLEVLEETTVNKISNFAKVLTAQNIINAMSEEKRRDVAYIYGRNVSDKTDDEVLILLAGLGRNPMEGFLLMDENVDEFIVLSKKMEQENPDVQLKIVLKKSIVAGLIIAREGSYYTAGGDPIGLNESEALSYLKDRAQYVVSLKKEIADKFKENVVKKVEDDAKRSVGFNPSEGTEKLENIDNPDFNPLNLSKEDMKKYAELKGLPAAKLTNDPEKIKSKVIDYLRSINKLVE